MYKNSCVFFAHDSAEICLIIIFDNAKLCIFSIFHTAEICIYAIKQLIIMVLYSQKDTDIMLKRKIYRELLQWKNGSTHDCVLVKGARQVGKTYIVREFGRREYQNFIEINFLRDPDLKDIFSGSLDADEIYKRMTANIPNIRIMEGSTLIFLDEIQKCSAARTALKFLAEDKRCDVIASGSLLGRHYGQDADEEVREVESIPVGYERPMILRSLDFEEFLWAYGYPEDTIEYLKSFYLKTEKVPDTVHEKYRSLLREYLVVGGMPEVVDNFMRSKDFNQVQTLQEMILSSYDDDISNHARGAEKTKVRNCFDSIPRQLARENKKFKFSEVEKKASSRKFGNSIAWLRDSDMVNICYNVYEPYLPLAANAKENEYKLYMNDTGLLMARYGFQTKLAVLRNTIRGTAKGGIYENLISEMLIKRGYLLNYYKTEDSRMEIEFIIEKEGTVIPVEVKAGSNPTPSLNSFIKRFDPPYAYKLTDGNIGAADGKITLPHYMAMFL